MSKEEQKTLDDATKEVNGWPEWLRLNASLLFEEEQERQRVIRKP